MKEWKSIFGLLLLLVGSFVFYKLFPVYWRDYRLGRVLDEQSINYTYNPKSESDIAVSIAQKAQDFDIPLAPEQVTVERTGSELMISASYTAHVDLPFYPLDLHFNTTSKNKDVMAK